MIRATKSIGKIPCESHSHSAFALMPLCGSLQYMMKLKMNESNITMSYDKQQKITG